MNLSEFDSLLGQDSYVRCRGKTRIDSAIVNYETASDHVEDGGQIGWWVRSGYIVIDIDEGQKEAQQVLKHLKVRTLMCKTPKGLHLYFRTKEVYPQKVGMVLPCGLRCDFRCANKGYVLLPWNSKGRTFNKRRRIAELPLEFTPMLDRKDSLLGLRDGDGRNATLFSHLMAYKNRGASNDQVASMAYAINDLVFADPMQGRELEKVIKSIGRYEAKSQNENPYLLYNAKGVPNGINARAICDYFVNRGDIFVLGGECYQYKRGVYVEASSHVRNTIREMVMLDDLISQSRIMDVFRLIVDDVRLQKATGELNADKHLINFLNGVYNTETGQLLPHDSKYLQTIQIPHTLGEYKPFTVTRLYKFFKLTKLPKEDIKMILQYMAYCLTLDYGLKTFMILCGQSNTGKSVLLRFIETMVGRGNTSALSMHELSARFYPAQLYNRLLNSCGDNGALPLQSIENLKKITGGDQIMHEKKGKEPFFFVPFAKLIFSFNQLPLQLEEKSNAFYKRMRILYMNTELFLDNDYVNELCSDESIQEVLPYLLTLLPAKAIPRTANSNRMVEGLRQDSDSIHAFITKKCVVGEDECVNKTALYEAYLEWCIKEGREGYKKHGFMRNMRARGYIEARRTVPGTGTREVIWKGITLKAFAKSKKEGG